MITKIELEFTREELKTMLFDYLSDEKNIDLEVEFHDITKIFYNEDVFVVAFGIIAKNK